METDVSQNKNATFLEIHPEFCTTHLSSNTFGVSVTIDLWVDIQLPAVVVIPNVTLFISLTCYIYDPIINNVDGID